ncbi:MAG: hypothetical protein WBZ45_03300 [Acidimicrobiia bacterium]
MDQDTQNDRNTRRDEVYERIPWEMLEQKKNDRPWLAYGIAGAIVLGALAYSIMGNRPVGQPQVAATVTAPTVPPDQSPDVASPPPVVATSPSPTSPTMTAEADLYAVDPERVLDEASAYAEWFATEYLSVDGSEESRQVLASLLPPDIPAPEAGDGTRVFVEWVRATTIEEVAPLIYRVSVLARTMAAGAEGLYVRQPTRMVTVDISMSGDTPAVVISPSVEGVTLPDPVPAGLVEPPADVRDRALGLAGTSEVVGGVPGADGTWQVVVLATGPDGVVRPQTVVVP